MTHDLMQEPRNIRRRSGTWLPTVPLLRCPPSGSRQVATIDNGNRAVSTGRTPTRCAACKKFTRLAPGDTECAACAGRLPLPITTKAGGR